jgi:hypothetical protein
MLLVVLAVLVVAAHTTLAQEIHYLEALVLLGKVTLVVLATLYQTKAVAAVVRVQGAITETQAVKVAMVCNHQLTVHPPTELEAVAAVITTPHLAVLAVREA